jgi:hypothetical protein
VPPDFGNRSATWPATRPRSAGAASAGRASLRLAALRWRRPSVVGAPRVLQQHERVVGVETPPSGTRISFPELAAVVERQQPVP